MKLRIAIIDYGVGNLRSVEKGLLHSGAEVITTSNINSAMSSDGIILPGVGAFKDAMKRVRALDEKLKDYIKEKPVLGICLGMQMYFTESEENGLHKGLDLMRGRVVMFPRSVKIPQMGWNSIKIKKKTKLLEGIKDGDYFYFVHSYYAKPEEDVTTATSNYGLEFPAIVEKNNAYATQFHPEKSGNAGLKILQNFVEIAKKK
ncbi:MAG: imidazole glycerol phosphate synthase subunit HisH [Candidatus Hydrothermarchaeaceae archaeon]